MKPSRGSLSHVLLYLIAHGPGRTEREFAQAISGSRGVQQAVNPTCRMLAELHLVKRVGRGGPSDPYRYFLA